MILISSTRLSRITARNNILTGWQYFWMEIEACVAVCMVSVTAFRGIFSEGGRGRRDRRERRWYSSAVGRNLERRKLGREWLLLDNVGRSSPSTPISARKSWVGSGREGVDEGSELEGGRSNEQLLHVPRNVY